MTHTIPSGFSKYEFISYEEAQNFIWGYLYENGLQYHAPFSDLKSRKVCLIYEDK